MARNLDDVMASLPKARQKRVADRAMELATLKDLRQAAQQTQEELAATLGVRQAVELLAALLGSLHDAHHEAMECLGRMVWESQRSGRPPDGAAYVDQLQRLATRD